LFPGKLKSRWTGPYQVTQVFPYGVLELQKSNGETFKVNGQRVRHYEDGAVKEKMVFQLQDPISEIS